MDVAVIKNYDEQISSPKEHINATNDKPSEVCFPFFERQTEIPVTFMSSQHAYTFIHVFVENVS